MRYLREISLSGANLSYCCPWDIVEKGIEYELDFGIHFGPITQTLIDDFQ